MSVWGVGTWGTGAYGGEAPSGPIGPIFQEGKFTIIDAFFDYNQGRIIYTLDPSTPFTGSAGNLVSIILTVAEKIVFCYKDSSTRTLVEPYYDAAKGRSHNLDPKLNYPLGTP